MGGLILNEERKIATAALASPLPLIVKFVLAQARPPDPVEGDTSTVRAAQTVATEGARMATEGVTAEAGAATETSAAAE